MTITIKKCSICQDYRTIYITENKKDELTSDTIFAEGDYYHNNIHTVEDTLLKTLNHLDIPFEIIYKEIDCAFGQCD